MDVATYLNATAKTMYEITGKYEPFDRIGVNNISGFIRLVQEGNPEAVRTYTAVRDICCFE